MIVYKTFWIFLLINLFVEVGSYKVLRAESTQVQAQTQSQSQILDDKVAEILKEDVNEDTEEEELTGGIQTDQVLIRGLNKVTAHISDIVAPIGQKIKFGHLEIAVHLCQKSPPEDPPESTAYLDIQEVKPDEKPSALFSGWMFASSPAISALEHPVYDVWVLNCQGRIVHELPVIDAESKPWSLEDISLKSKNLLSETPTIEAFNRGFNHP